GRAVDAADGAFAVVLVPVVDVGGAVLEPGHVHVGGEQRAGLGVEVDGGVGLGHDDRDARRAGNAGVLADLAVQRGDDAGYVLRVGQHPGRVRAARVVVDDHALGVRAERGQD